MFIPAKLSSLSLVISLISTIAAAYLYTSRPRLAYIDTDRLLNSYQAMLQARRQYQHEKQTWEKNLTTLAQEATAAATTVQKLDSKVDNKERKATTEMALLKRQQFLTYRQAIQQRDQQEQQRITQPVIATANRYITRFSKANHYDIVFTSAGQGDVLYINEGVDVTKQVIAELNQALQDSTQRGK